MCGKEQAVHLPSRLAPGGPALIASRVVYLVIRKRTAKVWEKLVADGHVITL